MVLVDPLKISPNKRGFVYLLAKSWSSSQLIYSGPIYRSFWTVGYACRPPSHVAIWYRTWDGSCLCGEGKAGATRRRYRRHKLHSSQVRSGNLLSNQISPCPAQIHSRSISLYFNFEYTTTKSICTSHSPSRCWRSSHPQPSQPSARSTAIIAELLSTRVHASTSTWPVRMSTIFWAVLQGPKALQRIKRRYLNQD